MRLARGQPVTPDSLTHSSLTHSLTHSHAQALSIIFGAVSLALIALLQYIFIYGLPFPCLDYCRSVALLLLRKLCYIYGLKLVDREVFVLISRSGNMQLILSECKVMPCGVVAVVIIV